MLENLLLYYDQFLLLSKNNPIIAGFIGIYFGAILTYLSRNVPMNIYNFLSTQLTTELILDREGNSWDRTQIPFENFSFWVKDCKSYFSRVFTINRVNGTYSLVSGLGVHLFIHNKSIFWYRIIDLESSGSETIKKRIIITTFGRNKNKLQDLFNQFKDLHTKIHNDTNDVYILDCVWQKIHSIPKRSFESIFINNNEKNQIFSTIDTFLENEDLYKKLGMPYRLTIMLEGPTGTGKTSIIKGLANKYNRNIYIAKPNDLLTKNFINDISSINNGFLVIEDIDSLSSISTRGDDVNVDKVVEDKVDTPILEKTQPEVHTFSFDDFMAYGISEVLNTLDGLIETNNLIIIMTTNKIDKIDKAVIRPGRVDKIIHIGWLNRDTIIESCNTLLGGYDYVNENNLSIDYISGADLINKFMLKTSANNFIDEINKVGIKKGN